MSCWSSSVFLRQVNTPCVPARLGLYASISAKGLPGLAPSSTKAHCAAPGPAFERRRLLPTKPELQGYSCLAFADAPRSRMGAKSAKSKSSMGARMKFSKTLLLGAALAAALALSAGTAGAGGKQITALATGSGQISNGAWRTFSFTAHTDGSGTSSGQGQLDSRVSDTRLHLDVSCLSVQGNVAFVSGLISDSNDPDFVGNSFIFAVMDNGEGATATGPDEISYVFSNADPLYWADCTGIPIDDVPFVPIEAGNIQVH